MRPTDQSTIFLFGDAGTATALERDEQAHPMQFLLGSDGSGEKFLIQPAGGIGTGLLAEMPCRSGAGGSPVRGPQHLYMDGSEVFSFTLRRVPTLVHQLLEVPGGTWRTCRRWFPIRPMASC